MKLARAKRRLIINSIIDFRQNRAANDGNIVFRKNVHQSKWLEPSESTDDGTLRKTGFCLDEVKYMKSS